MDYGKLDELINKALVYETDNYLTKLTIKPAIGDKLLLYQHRHVFTMLCALRHNDVVLDGSDPGTGKTYTTCAIAKQLNMNIVVICPKSIISNWHNVCKYFNIKPLLIVNYESIKLGKQYDKEGNHIKSEYIEIQDGLDDEKMFKWKLPINTMIVFDEVHICNNKSTTNSKLLRSTKDIAKHKNTKIIMLSATISDRPETFGIYGYMLGFYKTMRKANGWIKGMQNEDRINIGLVKTNSIHKLLYPEKGSRMRIAELGKDFPENQISAICYNIDSNKLKEVNSIFADIKNKTLQLKISPDNEKLLIIAEIVKTRMKIEKYKIPIFEELILEYQTNGLAVAVFVNFKETLFTLANKFKTSSIVYGDQTIDERDNVIKNFQDNKTNLIICTMGSGSMGLSLHDLHGVQRISLISPSYKAIQLKQTLGRIARAGSLTPAIQRLVYISNTIEESMCRQITEKLKFLSDLNDDDLLEIFDS